MSADPQNDLRRLLQFQGELHGVLETERRSWAYRSPEEFVLLHGRVYTGRWTGRYRRGLPRLCYGNAIILAAVYGLRYVEGFAIGRGLDMPVAHAWNAEEDGTLVDSTWLNQADAYLGVEFSVERADDATWRGDGSVLDDFHRNWPIYQKPWTGEDYSLAWPPSERLDMLRSHAAGKLSQAQLDAWKAANLHPEAIDGR